jgi:hypothetical protein
VHVNVLEGNGEREKEGEGKSKRDRGIVFIHHRNQDVPLIRRSKYSWLLGNPPQLSVYSKLWAF